MIDAFTDITYRYARAYMHIHIHIHINIGVLCVYLFEGGVPVVMVVLTVLGSHVFTHHRISLLWLMVSLDLAVPPCIQRFHPVQ